MAVRCRYDETAERRFKTVELIIEQADWTPPTERAEPSPEHVVPVHTVIGIRVDLHETELQSKVEKAGGAWNRQKKNYGK